MTILAFGCSIAHGAETVVGGNCEANIPFSYPALVAQHLGVTCINRAFCGNSNENIFHDAVEMIPKFDNLSAVIVGWTSSVRETWQCDGRTWQFISGWCNTGAIAWKSASYHVPAADGEPEYSADRDGYMPALKEIYHVLSRYKFDFDEYTKKRNHYAQTLRAYCNANNIRLIETSWSDPVDGVDIDLRPVGEWWPANYEGPQRHPNRQEQQMIADQIVNHYQL